LALPQEVGHRSLTTLREKLIKIVAKVVRHGRYNTFQPRADLQNQAIGWLLKGCSSYGSGMVVRFSRIWVSVSSGESRFRRAGGDPTLVADDNLHPSEKVYTPWADTIVPLAESALLKEKTL